MWGGATERMEADWFDLGKDERRGLKVGLNEAFRSKCGSGGEGCYWGEGAQ